MIRRTTALHLLVLGAGLATASPFAAAADPAPEMRLCATKPSFMTALRRTSTQARAVPMGQRLTLRLAPEASVMLPGTSAELERERARAHGTTYAGVARLEATGAGTHRVSIDRDAWLDIVTASGKLLDPSPEEGTFDCDGARKVLVYVLPAAGTYWLQIALSPRSETLLAVIPAD